MTVPTEASEFSDRVVVVTGVQSPLSAEYARYLGSHGASVVVHDDDGGCANSLASELRDRGCEAVAAEGAPVHPEDLSRFVAEVDGRFGRVDALITSPGGTLGVDVADLDAADVETADIGDLIEEVLVEQVALCRAFVPLLTRSESGRIVATTSGCGAFGFAGSSVFAAAAAGIIGFTKALALELREFGVLVNAVAPIVDAPPSDRYLGPGRSMFSPRYVVPAVAYLSHQSCEIAGEVLTAGAGRIGRIFVGTNIGAFEPEADIGLIGSSLARIMNIDRPVVPRSALDELILIDV
jgi:NAD(P)-dependent dehydrogenase (short-subunit alcohol dehydrogenase family)